METFVILYLVIHWTVKKNKTEPKKWVDIKSLLSTIVDNVKLTVVISTALDMMSPYELL